MKSKLFLFLIAGAFMASCSSVRHTAATAPVDASVVSFTVADVKVNPEKISQTTSWSFNPFKRVSVETVKDNTTARMLQDAKADVLVEPEYIIEQRGFLRGGSVTVIGFPATYSNFHKMTPEEAELFKAVNMNKSKKKEHKKRFFLF